MVFAIIKNKFFCGIDLHARHMYVCVKDRNGNILFHRNLRTDFSEFKQAIQPFLPDMAVAVDSTHHYYWLNDACQNEGIPFYLGHAYYMKLIHGGKTKTDRIDCKKVADLMRSNMLPLAYAYPKEKRATRALLRRRHRFSRIRAECYAHIQTIFRQHALEISPKDVKDKSSRRELITRFDDPDIQANIESDLDLIEFLDPKLKRLEQQIRARARHHDRTVLNILLSIPGIGDILSLIILYEIDDINRFQSHQQFCSYSRLVKCERSSAGKKSKGGNQKIGNPYLKWAIGEIIIHASHTSTYIGDYYQKLQAKFGKDRAKSIIAHKFGIAIYYMLKNKQAFDEKRFVQDTMK